MKNVLVFGATGIVGGYLTVALRKSGYGVIATGKRESDNGFFQDYSVPYYPVNVFNEDVFTGLPKKDIEVIIHLAGPQPAYMKKYEPKSYINEIFMGTFNVLNYVKTIKAAKIIFAHTRADTNYLMGTKSLIQPDVEKKFPLKSDHSIYAICKNAAVDLIEHYHYQYNIKRFVFRLPTIYAYHPNKYFYVDGERKPIAYRYIIERATQGLPIEIWGDPSKEKEITYIKDLIQIIMKAIESEKDGGIYNVGRGIGVTLEEQIKGIIEVFSPSDNPSEVIYRPDMPDARQFIHDISKTQEELGYNPQYDYISLLKDFKKEMDLKRFEKLWGNPEDYE